MQALLDAIAQAPRHIDAQRVFHGRGGQHPGFEHWTLDAYPPVWVLTSFKSVSDDELAQVQAALTQRWAHIAPGEPLNLVFQTRIDGRSETHLLAGSVPEPHVVSEGGARYGVHVLKGQNHGLFLDMAEGRAWVRQHAAGQKVLNLFAYTCAFSVAALQGGARHVLNIDMAAGAIATGQHNHALNGLKERASFMAHDIFKTWGKITRAGAYGLVIVDPPSYQKGSFVARKDYPRLLRRLPDLVAPGGHVLLCLNAPEIGTGFLQEQMAAMAPELVFEQRLPNPAAFADVDPERALKVLVYRAPDLPGVATGS
ncbi:MAG: class I SAM-dependent methyltransferase [Hydrogenophaga sp.]|nr:class I SAM-dependent methyltransferase [Hydrogenophaga sp.]